MSASAEGVENGAPGHRNARAAGNENRAHLDGLNEAQRFVHGAADAHVVDGSLAQPPICEHCATMSFLVTGHMCLMCLKPSTVAFGDRGCMTRKGKDPTGPNPRVTDPEALKSHLVQR